MRLLCFKEVSLAATSKMNWSKRNLRASKARKHQLDLSKCEVTRIQTRVTAVNRYKRHSLEGLARHQKVAENEGEKRFREGSKVCY